jgi:hypothetical protein
MPFFFGSSLDLGGDGGNLSFGISLCNICIPRGLALA